MKTDKSDLEQPQNVVVSVEWLGEIIELLRDVAKGCTDSTSRYRIYDVASHIRMKFNLYKE
jgi:hypothetical protein